MNLTSSCRNLRSRPGVSARSAVLLELLGRLRPVTTKRVFLLLVTVTLIGLGGHSYLSVSSSARRASQSSAAANHEEAYRANNLGVALLEQFKYKEAAEAFKRALQLDPKL